MNVSLTPQLEAFVHDQVASGRYDNASEVVRDALRQMDERGQHLQWVRAEVQKGLDSAARGDVVEFTDELMDEILRESDERARLRSRVPDAAPA